MEETHYKRISDITPVDGMLFSKGIDPITGKTVTIKTVLIEDTLEGLSSSILGDFSLQHKNIVSLIDVQIKDKGVDFIYEHMDLNLKKLIYPPTESGQIIKPRLLKKILYQVLSGVSYYHSNNIFHLEIKPRNVLIDMGTEEVKLGQGHMHNKSKAIKRWSSAPEILLGSPNYSASANIWSVGCMFVEMAIGKPIFNADKEFDTLSDIFSFFGMPNEETWPGVTALPQYASACKPHSEKARKNLAESVSGMDPDGFRLVSKMLCMIPTARISAQDALNDPYLKDAMNA
ncbi:cell division control protein 2 homolog [Mercurialis annua]|uniref:cell division control protein 2 homolog n=1 Tax=Mercurialis annua TaxID=3986 RepID=UPI00215FA6D9|nr:cell division control protein 2 homolog [Mercurialis annua]XP_050238567.1 cell division control protein 2 homolog [Mercurialis annua]